MEAAFSGRRVAWYIVLFALGMSCVSLMSSCLTPARADRGRIEPEKIAAPRDKDIVPDEGYYTATGKLGGDDYECIVVIQKKSPQLWIIRWYSASIIRGVGMIDKGSFVTGWNSTDMMGTTSYSPEWDEKTKRHKWVGKQVMVPSNGEVSVETLEFLRPFKLKE